MHFLAGYSVSVGQVNGVPLYFTGAPRFEHVGQIVVFTHTGNNWNVTQRINGEQVGKVHTMYCTKSCIMHKIPIDIF